ncbi:probable basic-leucine zipper transcription factor N [Eurosta solidaginis]|uniref:probable basic-leucine zipper transcription factor N n=1 Tax=Eurosta solidaginis TaxID=178769 RepID=UPI003530D4BD
MLSEEDGGMDYDELTLNPLLAEIEAETETDYKKEKQRRYWTPTEEQKFFEIWGRDNWRLTRHGKNTIFFAQWAAELKERFDIEVKQEEIQAKVNQTRAKFRQVKKQIAADKNCSRWKKFSIIDKILKNQYRPKDAEPIPKAALVNNRDIDASEVGSPPSPSRSARQSSPTSITSSSNTQEAATNSGTALENNGNGVSLDLSTTNTADIDIKVEGDYMADSSITTSLFNTSAELFNDPMDEVKTEYPSEYHNFANYTTANNHFDAPHPTCDDEDEEPQLHTLQTPQQLLQQQQEQQQQQQMQQEQYQQYPPTSAATVPPPPDTTTSNNNNGQLHTDQILQETDYDQVVASTTYVIPNQGVVHNQNHFTAPTPTQEQDPNPVYNSQYAAIPTPTPTTNHNSANSVAAAPMKPPTSYGRGAPGQPRRRRATPASTALVAGGAESLESMYLSEVRKKNCLLAEQLEIARKRMLLEERKVTLLEQFFPKCLEMQEKILGKLNNNGGGGGGGNT